MFRRFFSFIEQCPKYGLVFFLHGQQVVISMNSLNKVRKIFCIAVLSKEKLVERMNEPTSSAGQSGEKTYRPYPLLLPLAVRNVMNYKNIT